MKADFSYHHDMPSLIIKSSEFIRALNDVDEKYLLRVAVEGFAAQFDVPSHFDDDVNEAILQWLDKSGSVIYTIKERHVGRALLDEWCEVYVLNGTQLIDVVISEDNGRHYSLNNKQEVKRHE